MADTRRDFNVSFTGQAAERNFTWDMARRHMMAFIQPQSDQTDVPGFAIFWVIARSMGPRGVEHVKALGRSVRNSARGVPKYTLQFGVSDRHAITEELMVFVVAALAHAQVFEVTDELDCLDPFHHFKT